MRTGHTHTQYNGIHVKVVGVLRALRYVFDFGEVGAPRTEVEEWVQALTSIHSR